MTKLPFWMKLFAEKNGFEISNESLRGIAEHLYNGKVVYMMLGEVPHKLSLKEDKVQLERVEEYEFE